MRDARCVKAMSKRPSPIRNTHYAILGLAAVCALLTGCDRKGEPQSLRMWNDSRLKPMEESPMPGQTSSSRVIPVGTVARGQLMEQAWEDPGASLERTVDAHVKSLRAKLRAVTPEQDPIVTHRGIGYALRERSAR